MARGLMIIPAFNEEHNIGKVLQSILNQKLALDIVVINDGSCDNTRQVVLRFNVEVISHPFNLGYGCALQTGFKYARSRGYDYVIQFDADGQHDPEDIVSMVLALEKGSKDIIIGSRFLGRGSFRAGFLKTVVLSLMRVLIRIFTGSQITDPTSGFKGLSRRVYSFFSGMGNFPSDYPDADIIIQMLRWNYSVSEIPINVTNRNQGKSMHSGLKPIIYLLKILISIMAVLLRRRDVKEH